MFDDAYQSGINSSLRDLAKRPAEVPQPAPRFNLWRSITAAPRGITTAAGEVFGSTADVVKAFGAAYAQTLEADPRAVTALGEERIRQGAEEGKRQIATGEAMTSDVGQSFRAAADEYRPDAVTAHAAERLVFDLTRAGSKVVGGALVAGPFGIGAAGLEEGITQAEALRQQGVDDQATRAKVGAIQGGSLALGAALPVVGKGVLQTAALVGIGGPGAFMATAAASRKILEDGGYKTAAESYDPFDPVGLAVSTLIPLGFGAYGLRTQRKAAAKGEPAPIAPDAEAVDAARVALAAEHHRTASLVEPIDLPGLARDDAASTRAAAQMARGEPVSVTDVAPSSPEAVARLAEAEKAFSERLLTAAREDAEALSVLRRDEPAPVRQEPESVRSARQAVDQGLAPDALPPEVRNLVVGLQEAGQNAARAARMLEDFDRTLKAQPGRSPVDISADVVEASRAGREVTPAGPTKLTPVQQRLADLESRNPKALDVEIPRAWDERGEVSERMTARDYLAQVEQEAAAELADVDLVRVAAGCAITA